MSTLAEVELMLTAEMLLGLDDQRVTLAVADRVLFGLPHHGGNPRAVRNALHRMAAPLEYLRLADPGAVEIAIDAYIGGEAALFSELEDVTDLDDGSVCDAALRIVLGELLALRRAVVDTRTVVALVRRLVSATVAPEQCWARPVDGEAPPIGLLLVACVERATAA